MPGFFSDISLAPNRIERARQSYLENGGRLIDLTSTNPTQHSLLFPSEFLRPHIQEYLDHRRYEPSAKGLVQAREAVVRYYQGRTPSLPLDIDQVFLTSSTSESYRLLFSLLCNPGDNVLVPNIGYPLLELIAADLRIQLRTYLLTRSDNRWEVNTESFLEAVNSQTRAVVLISPHNPCGLVMQQAYQELKTLRLPLIVDEVFAAFPLRSATVPCLAALYPELPVFTLNGISKQFALPDLKLGWIALNSTARHTSAPRLELLNDTYLGANSLSQAVLPCCFELAGRMQSLILNRLMTNLRIAEEMLRFPDSPIQVLPPDGGWSLMLGLGSAVDEEDFIIELINRGVLFHPGFFYGCEAGAYLIASLLVSTDLFQEGLSILASTVQSQG